MDVWENLSYGQHPTQKMDVWELNDLAPRAGWPALLCFSDGTPKNKVGKTQNWLQGPLFARKGLLVAHAKMRWEEAQEWSDLQQDATAAIHRLPSLQINPKRIGLWGFGLGGILAIRAAEELGAEHIHAAVSLGDPEPPLPPRLDVPIALGGGLPEEMLFRRSGPSSIRVQQQALKWTVSRLADKQRGSKWKIRRKKK